MTVIHPAILEIWSQYIDEIRYGPDLTPIVQEVVNLNGWTQGTSSLTFIVKSNLQYPPPVSGDRSRRVMAYERIDQPPFPPGTNDAYLFIWLQCSTPPCPSQ